MKAREEFFVAVIMGDLDAVKSVFQAHPDALSWMSPAGYPPLHMAILNNRDDIAVFLVERGADLQQEAVGESAAKLADRKGMLEILTDAVNRQETCRQSAIESCGDEMRRGLEKPVAIAKKPLTLRRPGLS